MKKLITIFLLLLIVTACTTQKHKTKEKIKTEQQEKEVYSISTQLRQDSNLSTQTTDSTVQKSELNASRSFGSIAQNLTLKNNGKCTEGGEIRFLKFTDAQGNMTEVPVNDNTDVNFNTASELTEENTALKTEVSKLIKEKSNMKTKLKAATEQKRDHEQTSSSVTANIETDKKQNSFMSYVWCIIIAIIVWEAGKFYIKKQFKKP